MTGKSSADAVATWPQDLAAATRASPVAAVARPHDQEPLDLDAIDPVLIDRCRASLLPLRSQLGRRGVLAVASPDRRNGNSPIAAGVAVSLARSTSDPVLLLDLDFECPGQAALFARRPAPGLADYLRGGRLRAIPDAGGRLWLIPAGMPSSKREAEFLRTLLPRDFLGVCGQRFTWVVADLPPLRQTSASSPALGADGYILVGRHRKTTFRMVEDALATLPPNRPMGLVLTADSRPRRLARLF
ncbi:MAG TPA: hypothetical protein VJO72_02220 [Candidatus Dormibacteraeota bacterium]|nr:hypothetical protein [Candidatus Dormibacteraeota bacterium]